MEKWTFVFPEGKKNEGKGKEEEGGRGWKAEIVLQSVDSTNSLCIIGSTFPISTGLFGSPGHVLKQI